MSFEITYDARVGPVVVRASFDGGDRSASPIVVVIASSVIVTASPRAMGVAYRRRRRRPNVTRARVALKVFASIIDGRCVARRRSTAPTPIDRSIDRSIDRRRRGGANDVHARRIARAVVTFARAMRSRANRDVIRAKMRAFFVVNETRRSFKLASFVVRRSSFVARDRRSSIVDRRSSIVDANRHRWWS